MQERQRQTSPSDDDPAAGVVARRIEGHFRDNAQPQPESDVGLDYVGVDSGEHDVGLDAGAFEGAVDTRAAGEAGVVGDQRILRQAG